MKKTIWTVVGIIGILLIASGAYYFGRQQQKTHDVARQLPAEKQVSSSNKKASSYSVDAKFSAGGEAGQAADEQSELTTAKSGAKITKDDIQEARQQLRQQGVNDGDFSDLDIAKVIDKANSESLDLKQAVLAIYPHYFD